MRYKLLAALVFISCGLQAQQVNPVPDYVFQNRMSVGRTTVTDTLAYFSMGPRYGAIRGFMPPMVVDTALVTGGTKRNGLTIFSIQKNKYVYWDSVGSKWAEMAGTGGTAINSGDTASMLNPYIRAAGNGLTKSGQSLLVDTATIATRARVQKAVDSINTNVALKVNISDTASMLTPYTRGSGTTNYLPKFTGTRTFGNSQIFDNGTNVGIGTTAPSATLDVRGSAYFETATNGTDYTFTSGASVVNNGFNVDFAKGGGNYNYLKFAFGGYDVITWGRSLSAYSDALTLNSPLGSTARIIFSTLNTERMRITSSGGVGIGTTNPQGLFEVSGSNTSYFTRGTKSIMMNPNVVGADTHAMIDVTSGMAIALGTGSTERLRITSDGELLIGTTSDAGAYALQVAGSIYNTTGAVLAASSGEVYFGGTTDQGAYIIQAYGGLYNTGSVILSATTGIVGVGGAGSSVGTGYSTVDARGANTTNTGAFRVSSSDYSRDAQWYMLSGNMFFGTVSNHDIIFTTNATNQLRLTNGGDFGVGTMSPTYKLDVSGTIRTTTTLTTGAPTSGTAKPWRLGEAATVSPTSPNRTIRVEIDGTVYYLHAKTTND